MNHINSKTLLGLGAATAVAVVAAVGISLGRKPAGDTAAAGLALPALAGHVNDVKGVTLTVAEDRPAVTLVKGGKGWTVQEKGGYPADTGKLRALLLALSDAGLLEAKTANAQRYGELGVEDVKSKDAKGVQVSLDGLAKPARLIVGNVNSQNSGTFVRDPDEKQSWLAKGNLAVERDPAQWLDTALADVGAERIAEIVLTRPDGKAFKLYKDKPGDANFKVADLPAGRQLASPTGVNALASTLSGLTLSDAGPAASLPPPDGKLLHARYRTFDGLIVEADAWKQDGKAYARFNAGLDRARAEAQFQATQAQLKADESRPKETQPAADPAKDRQQKLEALNREMETLRERFAGWTFAIPPYKYGNMDKSVDDLLKPVGAAKAEAKLPEARKPEAKKAAPKKPPGKKP